MISIIIIGKMEDSVTTALTERLIREGVGGVSVIPVNRSKAECSINEILHFVHEVKADLIIPLDKSLLKAGIVDAAYLENMPAIGPNKRAANCLELNQGGSPTDFFRGPTLYIEPTDQEEKDGEKCFADVLICSRNFQIIRISDPDDLPDRQLRKHYRHELGLFFRRLRDENKIIRGPARLEIVKIGGDLRVSGIQYLPDLSDPVGMLASLPSLTQSLLDCARGQLKGEAPAYVPELAAIV